ncbi:MAG: ribonuclease P protein component [Candidatus Marinimicrobia bacterium]|nr:ribonuclease P protein component [Candidatus Neomarinimicrobiota bacterium]
MNPIPQKAAESRGKLPFRQVLRLGRKVSTSAVSARVMPSEEPRLGMAVSRRFGNAVSRNRFKRRVRAAFRKYQQTLPRVAVVVSPALRSKETRYENIDEFFIKLCDYSA